MRHKLFGSETLPVAGGFRESRDLGHIILRDRRRASIPLVASRLALVWVGRVVVLYLTANSVTEPSNCAT